MTDLIISGSHCSIGCDVSRFDVNNYSVTLETFIKKNDLMDLRNSVVPGAVGTLFTVLGRPYYYDKTWTGNNTLILSPVTGSTASTFGRMHPNNYIVYVNNLSITHQEGEHGWINIKLEAYISGESRKRAFRKEEEPPPPPRCVYAGDGNGYVYKFKASDLSYVTNTTYTSGSVRGLAIDDNYVFTGTWGNRINRFNKSDLSFINQTDNLGYYVTGLDIDENYVYGLLDTTAVNNIRKLTKSLVEQNSAAFGAVPRRATNDANYLYVVGDQQVVKKYNKSNLSLAATSSSLGGNLNDVEVDDNYVYVSVATVKKIKKLNKNDLSNVSESISLPYNVVYLCSDENYIYTVPNISPYYIRKFSKSNLSIAATSNYDIGSSVNDIECDNDYIYVVHGGYVKKFNKSDLTYVTTTSSYSTRYEVEVDAEV